MHSSDWIGLDWIGGARAARNESISARARARADDAELGRESRVGLKKEAEKTLMSVKKSTAD